MNKKGEAVTLTMIIVGLIIVTVSSFLIRGELEKNTKVRYVGDSNTKIVYKIGSQNPFCDFNKIAIVRGNEVFFSSEDEAVNNYNYILDSRCN